MIYRYRLSPDGAVNVLLEQSHQVGREISELLVTHYSSHLCSSVYMSVCTCVCPCVRVYVRVYVKHSPRSHSPSPCMLGARLAVLIILTLTTGVRRSPHYDGEGGGALLKQLASNMAPRVVLACRTPGAGCTAHWLHTREW